VERTGSLRQTLKKEEENRLRGILLQVKVKWTANKNRPTPYLMRKVAIQNTKANIHSLKWKGNTHRGRKNARARVLH
jgi:hypothetical protein